VRSYAAKTGTPAGRFVLTNGSACDVRFTLAAESPDAVIAHDGIVAIVNPLNTLSRVSEKQLRAIFSGSVSDWSQLGGPPGPIIAILPDAASDESKVLASSLFFGVPIDNKVRRSPSSADVTRVVTGADKTSRSTIGLVAFSQAVSAKVVPLAYLPAPSVLSIASGRYPYTMTVAIKAASGHSADAVGLVDYARSRDGAAIVLKNGLIPREGL
jgi:phosphate transport system substrate-binding protein